MWCVIGRFACTTFARPQIFTSSFLSPIRGIGYSWGFETVQDREKALARKKHLNMVRWTNPESDLEVKKQTFYHPLRIEQEENVKKTFFSKETMNLTDFYEFVRYPFYAILTDPEFHIHAKRIKAYSKAVEAQRFDKERLQALGPDLAAAHFLLHRGCKVRFKGQEEFKSLLTGRRMPSDVPKCFEKGWHVEEIDVSCSQLVYEGLQNMRNLIYLKKLDMSYCAMMDSWCMDRITGEYQDTLEYLDISGCRSIDWNGLECIWRLRNLKTLVLKDMDHILDLQLLCLMLLEIFPHLEIKGVDYASPKLLKGTTDQHLVDELELMLLEDGVRSIEETDLKKSATLYEGKLANIPRM